MNAPFDVGCAGKTPHGSKAAALKHIKYMEKGHRTKIEGGRGPLNVYRCRTCCCWHIGTLQLKTRNSR